MSRRKNIAIVERAVERLLTSLNIYRKPTHIDGLGTRICYIGNTAESAKHDRQAVLAFMNSDIAAAVRSLNLFLEGTRQARLSLRAESIITKDGAHPYQVGYHASRYDTNHLYAVCVTNEQFMGDVMESLKAGTLDNVSGATITCTDPS